MKTVDEIKQQRNDILDALREIIADESKKEEFSRLFAKMEMLDWVLDISN